MAELTKMTAVIMATTMSEFLTHPFDVIKTKKQINFSKVSSDLHSPSQLTMIRKYIQNRAVKDLYKGFSPAIIKGVQLQTIRFGLYDIINQSINYSFHGSAEPPTGHGMFFSKLFSAFAASVVAGITSNPWVIIKVRMIADKSGDYRTLRQSFKNIRNKDGYREFLKGTTLSMARGVILSTVELTTYDTVKTLFKTKEGLDLRASFIGSTVASLTGALVSYPLDILRTLYLVENSGLLLEKSGMKQIVRIIGNVHESKGVKGFYQGFMPYLSKSLIYGPLFWNSLEIFTYFCKKYMNPLNSAH